MCSNTSFSISIHIRTTYLKIVKFHRSLLHKLNYFIKSVTGLLVEGVRDEDRYRREFAALAEGRNFFYGDNRSMKMTASGRRAHITFTLYTKRNQTNGQELRVNDSKKLRGSDFDGGKPTRFVTHGFLNDGNNPSCTLIRDG